MRNVALPGRFLRHKATREIYGYTHHLAENLMVEEVTEEEAFPERFMTKVQKERSAKPSKADLGVVKADKKPKKSANPDVANDASRGV